MSKNVDRHRVVILGGGFGGLNAAKSLRRSDVDVTLVDRRNFHLFQPLLYQVATGGLSPANIAAPLRGILRRQKNCQVLMGNVLSLDTVNRQVVLDHGRIPFDSLIIATGATHSYFGRDDWEQLAPGLKTIEDATEIRSKVFRAFEAAEIETDLERRKHLLTFVVVGGGPTGVELCGALAEIAKHSLKYDFRAINPADAHILLIESGTRILSQFPPALSESAAHSLRRLGVEIRLGKPVTGIAKDHVVLGSIDNSEIVSTHTVLWAAGVQASPLSAVLKREIGCELDRAGRVLVEADMSVKGHSNIFVIGDMANYSHQTQKPLPGVAPVAIQQGQFVAKLIDCRIRKRPIPVFRYRDYGNLATIGRSAAIADFGAIKLSGFIAWVLWLFIHLANIISFRNRVLVLFQWSWSYFSYDRSARIITQPFTSSGDE